VTRIRQAASAVLRRDGDERVYLALRNPELRFFGGFWAFPGGGVHPSDAALASDRLPGEELGAFVVSCAREILEELGMDLSAAPQPAAALETLRDRVLASEEAYAAWIRDENVALDAARFTPFLRLLTPPFSPIRFDTQFLRIDLERFPGAGEPVIREGELVEGRWATPAEWLRRWTAGELLIAPPVLLVLRLLDAHGWDDAEPELRRLEEGFEAGRIHPIFYNPAVQLMPLRTPTLPPATHTNAYLIGRDPAYLVDPASPHAEEQDRLLEALEEAEEQGGRVAAIVLTHHHPDHVGAVERIRKERGLAVWAHPLTQRLLGPAVSIDRTLEHGERLPLGHAPDGTPDWELELFHTPGHAPGHLCLFERRYGSLVCGDMVSTISSILVHPEDGDMGQYLHSLKRLSELPARMVFPAHGPATADAGVFSAQLAHREARQLSVQAAIEGGAETVTAVVGQVYGDVPQEMHGFAADSVRSILARLSELGWLAENAEPLRPSNLN